MPALSPHAQRLTDLRAEVRAIERGKRGERALHLPFGLPALDGKLAAGGLATAALHEATGAEPGLAGDAAATLFLAGIAARAGGTVLWALGRRDLFAPGLEQAGLPPSRLLLAEAGEDAAVLAVMEEGLRHGGLAAVVGEVRRAGLTASRRLQLAAEEGGTLALLLRRPRARDADPLAEPSTATTRWRVAPAPSAPLPVAVGVGRACWRLSLVRQRGGEPFDLTVEASDAQGRLALPAVPRDRQAAPRRRVAKAA